MEVKLIDKVILYSNSCPKCIVLAKALQHNNIAYETCNNMEIIKTRGINSVPALDVGGIVKNFIEALDWIEEEGLNESN